MNRLPGLDLLRAIAIVWVVVFHAYAADLIPNLLGIPGYGWMGVDLFFVLSGFLIGGQLLRPYARGAAQDMSRFYVRRLFRTLPPFAAVLALYLIVPAFREQPRMQPAWQFVSFTENLFIDCTRAKAFSHVWSLCVEEQFYLIAPIAVWLLLCRPATWKAVTVCTLLLIGGMVLRGYVWLHDLAPLREHAFGAFIQRFQERIYYPTWTRLDGLLVGVALAAVQAFRPAMWEQLIRRPNLLSGFGLALLALALCLFINKTAFLASVIGYPILALALGCLVAAGSSARSLIGRWQVPGAGLTAAMAYSLYLTHKEMFHLAQLAAGARLNGHPALMLGLEAAAVLAGGNLLYLAVERPALRLRDKMLSGKRPAVPVRPRAPAAALAN
jgi:peptidoglycan/LPS O-acetylase OafA/YrhL